MSGSALVPHTTTPATARPRARATSTVSAVWLSVPRPGRATISERQAEREREVGERLALVDRDEQPAGALDEDAVGARAQLARGGHDRIQARLRRALETRRDGRRDGRLVAQRRRAP